MQKIGIPKGLLYYRYQILWKAFFYCLYVPYITSEESNLEILKKGQAKSVDEACLALKIYLGHIESLKDKCDSILIPRIYSLEKGYQACTNFNCLYDLVKNIYPNLNIINYNIDVSHHESEKKGFFKIGKELGFNLITINHAYKLAKEVEKNYHDKLVAQGQKKLKSNKLKILLVGHHYNLEDALIGKRISSYLRKENIELLYSYEVPQEAIDKYSYQISTKIHWTMNKELLAAFAYFKDQVDGVIILTAFPCGPDSLANEMMIRKRGNSKVLLLTFEDLSSDTAIITRLESFIDMIKGGIHL